MFKTFNCLDLDIHALGYSSHFFLTDSENFKLMKHLQHFTLNFVYWRYFMEMRPIKKINLVAKVKFFRLIIQAILMIDRDKNN